MARRLALITGASAGIGAASARIYASHGYDVALTARRADRLEGLAAEIKLRSGVEAYAIPADLAEPTGVDTVLAAIAEQGRVVDALVNNAGYGLPGTYDSTSWADQAKFLQLMLISVTEMTHKVLPGMVERKFGRVVTISSNVGVYGRGGASGIAYAASKAALIAVTKGIAHEGSPYITANVVCPGPTNPDPRHLREPDPPIAEDGSANWLGETSLRPLADGLGRC